VRSSAAFGEGGTTLVVSIVVDGVVGKGVLHDRSLYNFSLFKTNLGSIRAEAEEMGIQPMLSLAVDQN